MENGKLFVIGFGLFGLIPPTVISKIPIFKDSILCIGIYIMFYVAVGYFISKSLTPKKARLTFLYLWFMLPITVFVDATHDWFVWSYDRNLFPIEILLFAVIMPICLFIGHGIYNLFHPNKSLSQIGADNAPPG